MLYLSYKILLLYNKILKTGWKRREKGILKKKKLSKPTNFKWNLKRI